MKLFGTVSPWAVTLKPKSTILTTGVSETRERTRHCLSQKRFRLQKLYAYAYTIGAVHAEHIDGCSAHGRETYDAPSLALEVLVPGIGTGVERGVLAHQLWGPYPQDSAPCDDYRNGKRVPGSMRHYPRDVAAPQCARREM